MKLNKGFTLLHFMVILAVVALLTAIITPAITEANSRTRVYLYDKDGKVAKKIENARILCYGDSGIELQDKSNNIKYNWNMPYSIEKYKTKE